LDLAGAKMADTLLARATESGFADLYWPVVYRVIAENK
jgi:hypothetical protein